MLALIVAVALALGLSGAVRTSQTQDSGGYLSWSADHAEAVGKAPYRRGRVGGFWDARLLKTERSYNYKLAATWMTPDVIRATARIEQLRDRLSVSATRALVTEAESAASTIIMIEIDPREGSGVIPDDWDAFLQPKERASAAIRGTVNQQLRHVRALAGVLRRNYDYDRFWVTFPLIHDDGTPVFGAEDRIAELIVRIYDKEGHVEWTIPPSVRGMATRAPQ